ncbi:MAG: STAS domain-containing protein [Alphaproteobacteria bacterium]
MATAFAPQTRHPDIMLLPSRFDSSSAQIIEHDARTFIQNGVRELVLNFSQVTYMTANGMHALLQIAKAVHAVQGRLMVQDITAQPKEMFESCLFDTIIPSYNHTHSQPEEAVAKMAA